MRGIKLFGTCGYWKIINFREITRSHNAGVDYFPITAHPIMFYSLYLTSVRYNTERWMKSSKTIIQYLSESANVLLSEFFKT